MACFGRRRRRRASVIAAAAAAVVTVIVAPVARAQAAPTGTSASDAAASCWEIKQNNESATDGVYWLQTPKLVAPEQFYCDMTTDGGGWVLVGRGREGWRPEYNGQGTTAQVRADIQSPSAPTRQLGATVIDGLLNGTRVDALPDGVRLRRAADTSGDSWQESRLHFANRDRWTWAFGAEHRIASWQIGDRSGGPETLPDIGSGSDYNRIGTFAVADQKYSYGFAYGSQAHGSTASDSYIYTASAGAGYPRPFTQVFLRPKLTQADLHYASIGDDGTAKSQKSPLLQSGVEPQEWGVTGRVDDAGEHYTEAQTVNQVGDTVFVGGNFKYVQHGKNGTKYDQPYLAGFDVHSGQWVSSFRPKFNGQVKTLAALPNGLLVAGGEFTQVNGQDAPGLAALDPTTGELDKNWQVKVEDRRKCCKMVVWDLQIHGNWLYVGGSFTHLKGKQQESAQYAVNAARIAIDSGTPDPKWNPELAGTVYDLDVNSDGSRVYTTGYVTSAHGIPVKRVAVLSSADGAPLVPGMKDPVFSSTTDGTYQQAISSVGDRVWLGGSEHSMFSYSPDDFSLLSSAIGKPGGDLQDIDHFDGVVYGQCHCTEWEYSDVHTWPDVTGFTEGDRIRFIGAWNEKTGAYEPEFSPWLNASHSQGGWGSFQDSTGKVWFAGDFTEGRMDNGWQWTWLGGFARFAPRDTTAPGAPSALTGTVSGDQVKLSWKGSSDDRDAAPQYEVLRDDRVISVQWGGSLTVPNTPGRYFVRAVDSAGNRSASTPVYQVGQ